MGTDDVDTDMTREALRACGDVLEPRLIVAFSTRTHVVFDHRGDDVGVWHPLGSTAGRGRRRYCLSDCPVGFLTSVSSPHGRSNSSTSAWSFAVTVNRVSSLTTALSPAARAVSLSVMVPRATCTQAWRPAVSRWVTTSPGVSNAVYRSTA